jgi:hypothetical protein
MLGINVTEVDGGEAIGSEWLQAHRALSRLARQRAAADADEGRWLLAALRSTAHVHLGFGSFTEYIDRLFGYGPRSIQEKLRVAEALERLPATSHALEHGELSWSAARELTRVAVAETEAEWLAFAAGKTVRQLEQVVAGARPGDKPSSPRDESARRHVLRFAVSAETLATFREAMRQLRRHCDARLDDDAALLAMARAVLGGPGDEGRSSYQVSLSVCTECGGGSQLANGELVSVGPEVVEMAHCDGQHLGQIPVVANDNTDLPPASAHVDARDAYVGARARQSIRPAVRRTVLQRDQRRCRVPGCFHASFLDVHHIVPRAEGGSNTVDNLLTLCGSHHRAVHRGELVIDRAEAGHVRFRHADGTVYGQLANPQAVVTQATVLTALLGLGFREREARGALAALCARAELRDAPAKQLLREALLKLTPVSGSAPR